MRGALGLAGWVVVVFGVAALGAQFMPGEWYASLRKPAWTPPNWVFGPAWMLLYCLMAVAAWMVWRHGGVAEQKAPLGLFMAQLVVNSAWSFLFFGLRSPVLALVDIGLLWALIVATIVAFRTVQPAAAALLWPYLAWATYATTLNAGMVVLNRVAP